MNFIKKISLFYHRYCCSKEQYARYLGVNIGNNCRIAIRNWSSEPYLVTIGNNVAITKGVSINTHGGGRVVRKVIPDFDCFGKVTIEDWAYIGSGSIILPGVTIGEGALVAAGSVVTKSVRPHMVVGGNPAKEICSVDEFIKRNEIFNVHSKNMSMDEKKIYLLSLPDEKFIKK